jgi:hypothetical protein
MNASRIGVKVKVGFFLADECLEEVVFDTNDFTSEDDFLGAFEAKGLALKEANGGRYISYKYLDLSHTPRGKFYPTGGVRWLEKAWQYAQWLNMPAPSNNTELRHGDRVRFENANGVPLEFTIFGFTQSGEAILDWDCYWVSKPVGHLTKLNLFSHIVPSHIVPMANDTHIEPWAKVAYQKSIDLMKCPPLAVGETVRYFDPVAGIKCIFDIDAYTMSGDLILDWHSYYVPAKAAYATPY